VEGSSGRYFDRMVSACKVIAGWLVREAAKARPLQASAFAESSWVAFSKTAKAGANWSWRTRFCPWATRRAGSLGRI
jgi:hypothetical protein